MRTARPRPADPWLAVGRRRTEIVDCADWEQTNGCPVPAYRASPGDRCLRRMDAGSVSRPGDPLPAELDEAAAHPGIPAEGRVRRDGQRSQERVQAEGRELGIHTVHLRLAESSGRVGTTRLEHGEVSDDSARGVE